MEKNKAKEETLGRYLTHTIFTADKKGALFILLCINIIFLIIALSFTAGSVSAMHYYNIPMPKVMPYLGLFNPYLEIAFYGVWAVIIGAAFLLTLYYRMEYTAWIKKQRIKSRRK